MHPHSPTTRPGALVRLAALFGIAVALNYPWELAQSPLYVGSDQWGSTWWHCFAASLGDGILIVVIFLAGAAAFGRSDWFEQPAKWHYGLMLATGAALAIAVEWAAVYVAHRWSYAAEMPLIPGLEIGVAPIVQMLILPPIAFRVLTFWLRRKADPPRKARS